MNGDGWWTVHHVEGHDADGLHHVLNDTGRVSPEGWRIAEDVGLAYEHWPPVPRPCTEFPPWSGMSMTACQFPERHWTGVEPLFFNVEGCRSCGLAAIAYALVRVEGATVAARRDVGDPSVLTDVHRQVYVGIAHNHPDLLPFVNRAWTARGLPIPTDVDP